MKQYSFLQESYSVGDYITTPYGSGTITYIDDYVITVLIINPFSEEYKNKIVTIPNTSKYFD